MNRQSGIGIPNLYLYFTPYLHITWFGTCVMCILTFYAWQHAIFKHNSIIRSPECCKCCKVNRQIWVRKFENNIFDREVLWDVAIATKFWRKNEWKSHKMGGNFSCEQAIDTWFQFRGRIFAISKLNYDTRRWKGQRYVTMATNFGTKTAVTGFITKIVTKWSLVKGFSRAANPSDTFMTARV